jgi:trans-aconitate methyltransferase
VTVSARQAWAVDTIEFGPDERILELGCGHGVAASLVCDRLESGRYVGLDRSKKMIRSQGSKRASRQSGCERFVETALANAGLDSDFHCVFAVHFPPLLRGNPILELQIVRNHLTEDGYLWGDPPTPEGG